MDQMTITIAPKYAPVLRQNGNLSRQPRFKEVSPNNFFTSLFRFVNTDIHDEPDYGNRERDAWLRRVWKLEPYLAGVLSSVVSIDKNRGWTITGGRNQVRRFVKMLHERFFFAPDLSGWRMSFGGCAQAYYTADLGVPIELARLGARDGPLWELDFMDPSRCYLTGNPELPLRYSSSGRGNIVPFGPDDYFRVVSMPDTDESLFGLGYCAVSRCIELAKIMIGIYQYDNEMLLNRAPRGLLLLKGITEKQWIDAMTARNAKLDGDEKKYYGAVHVLASLDPGVELQAQLVALSQLPAEFDQQTFTDLLMYGYALAFGYDPREFWPVSSGSLGTATETEAQHRKAGGKGGLDFCLGFSEKLNEELPDTVNFEFEERDLDGELANAAVEQAQADVIMTLYDKGVGIISQEQALIMAADRQLIDPDWTENIEDTTASDTDDDVGRALANERVQRAIWKYPNEPIVQYRFRVKNGRGYGEYRTLLAGGRTRRQSFLITRTVKRQIEAELEDYQRQLDELARRANEGEIDRGEFDDRLEALTVAILTLSILRGTEGENEAERLLIDAALMILENDGEAARLVGLETLTDPDLLNEALSPEGVATLQAEIDGSVASSLGADIYAGQYHDNAQGLQNRLLMWGTAALGLYHLGRLTGQPDRHYRWNLGGTINHCEDCARLAGQVHTGAEWAASGFRPQSRDLACNGYNCLCYLSETDDPIFGDF
jgi:hypothetical protein